MIKVVSGYVFSLSTTIVVLTLLSSCLAAPSKGVGGVDATAPVIRIVSPENYAMIQTTVNTRNITVKVEVVNFNLVGKMGQPPVPGEGHIHYYLDVNPPTALGQPAITAEGSFAHTVSTSHTWTNLSDGPHRLSVELLNHDETPLSPPAIDRVQTFLQYNIAAPSVRIISPKDGATLPAGDVSVLLEIHNFNIVGRMGEPNLSGEGHLHYFIDVDPPIISGQPAFTAEGTYAEATAVSWTWHNVGTGTHTFAVELVTNDHLPLYPPSLRPAYDKVTVTVSSSN